MSPDPAQRALALVERPAPWPIVQAGAAVLRRPAQPYNGQVDDAALRALVEGMRVTMLRAPGVGLAAPQVGVGLAIAVAQDKGVPRKEDGGRHRRGLPFQVWINPSYTPVGADIATFEEGCLSIKGWCAQRRRAARIAATYTDLNGAAHSKELEGWNARIFQHETDHLRGELYLLRADIATFRADV